MPRQAAVIAINGGLHDMQAVLNAIWSHLLPAMAERTLPINPYAYGQLAQELAMLELGPIKQRIDQVCIPTINGIRSIILRRG